MGLQRRKPRQLAAFVPWPHLLKRSPHSRALDDGSQQGILATGMLCPHSSSNPHLSSHSTSPMTGMSLRVVKRYT